MWSTRVWVRQCEITSIKIIFCFAYLLSTLYIFWIVQKHPVYFTCDTMLEKRGCECDSVKLAWKWDVIKFYQPACHENRSEPNYLSGQGYRSYYANLNLCQFDKHTSPIAMKTEAITVVLVKDISLLMRAKRNPWTSCSQYGRDEIQYWLFLKLCDIRVIL